MATSNNAWNSEFNNAKGALLVGNGTRPIVRTVGLDGQVLTANSAQADGVEWQTPGSGSLVNLSPYIVGPTQSDFTTIQDAINQAVLDGASSANPINIYIKPQSGGYIENLSLADGINLIGFATAYRDDLTSPFAAPQPVVLNGNISFSTAITSCYIQNIEIQSAAATAFDFTAGAQVSCFGCRIQTGAFPLFSLNTASQIYLSLDTCTLYSLLDLFSWVTANGFNLYTRNTFIQCSSGPSILPAAASFNFNFIDSYLEFSADSSAGASVSGIARGCYVKPLVTFPFFDATGQFLNIIFERCYIENTTDFVIKDTGLVQLLNSTLELMQYTSTSGLVYFNQSGAQANPDVSSAPTDNPCEISRLWFGNNFTDSQDVKGMRFRQTGNDTPAVLVQIDLNELESIVMRGKVVGANAAHTDTTGGDFMIVAQRASGGNVTVVGLPYTNVQATSTGNFAAAVDIPTQTVQVVVTGLAATNYNWTCTYDYQKMLSDA